MPVASSARHAAFQVGVVSAPRRPAAPSRSSRIRASRVVGEKGLERKPVVVVEVPGMRVLLGVARDEEHRQGRVAPAQRLGGGAAVQAWHDEIGDQDAGLLHGLGPELERLGAVGGDDDAVAGLPQGARQDRAEPLLVLHEQHRLAAARRGGGDRMGRLGGRLQRAREQDLEGGPPARLALHLDLAVALLHDPEHVASPSPVPLPLALVVKKGSKRWARASGESPVPVSATRSAT